MFQVNIRWGGSTTFGSQCLQPDQRRPWKKPTLLTMQGQDHLPETPALSHRPDGLQSHLLAWQFFNEIDNVFGPLNGDDVVAWHREMGQWLPRARPLRTSGHHQPQPVAVSGRKSGRCRKLDFSVYHSYDESAPGKGAATLARSFVKDYGKADEISESLASIHVRGTLLPTRICAGFRQAVWGGALGGSVGTAMSWWWQDIHKDDVYRCMPP